MGGGAGPGWLIFPPGINNVLKVRACGWLEKTLGKTLIGSWTWCFHHHKCLMKNLKIFFYSSWSWNMSRTGKEKGTTSFFPHLFTSLLGFSPSFSALPLSLFLYLPLALTQSLTQFRNSISFQLDWPMLSDLDFMWAGRISVLVFIRISFLSAQKYQSNNLSSHLSPSTCWFLL